MWTILNLYLFIRKVIISNNINDDLRTEQIAIES